MTEDKLPDQLNMDKATSAFRNLSERTSYKAMRKIIAARPGVFRGSFIPTKAEERERLARERASEIARLLAEEADAERLAREADKAGQFKRFARFWNRLDAARKDLIRLGAV